jgi:hypothetical protein
MPRNFTHRDDGEDYPIHGVSRQDSREFRQPHQASNDPSRVVERTYVYPFSRTGFPARGPITAHPMVERPDYMRAGEREFSGFDEPARRSPNYRHAEVSAKTLPSRRFDRVENFGEFSQQESISF